MSNWLIKPTIMYIGILSFLLSWALTANLMVSSSMGGLSTALAIGISCVAEPAKIVFWTVGVKEKRLGMFVVSIGLVILSMAASLGFLYVQQAEKVAMQRKSSDGYAKLDTLLALSNAQLLRLQKDTENLPSNYHTQRKNNNIAASALIADNKELTQQLLNFDGNKEVTANAMFVSIAAFLHITPAIVELTIHVSYSVFLDIAALLAGGYLYREDKTKPEKSRYVSRETSDEDDTQPFATTRAATIKHNEPEQIAAEQEPENRIADKIHPPMQMGFPTQSQQMSTDADKKGVKEGLPRTGNGSKPVDKVVDLIPILPKYVDGLFGKISRGGRLQGRRSIADKTSISKGQADRCHNFLKMEGLINVKGNSTYTGLEKEDLKKQAINLAGRN